MSFSIYQSKKFRNSWLVLGDLTPLSTVQNRHKIIYQTFQRLLAPVKTQQNSRNGHYCYSSCEKLELFYMLSFIFFVMYTAQRISYFMYSTHHVTWLDNFEMLCNFTRKEENLGMSNLRKRMFYLGIIYILRNFNYSTRYSISAYTSNGVLLDGLIDETIISAVTYQLHLHKSI